MPRGLESRGGRGTRHTRLCARSGKLTPVRRVGFSVAIGTVMGVAVLSTTLFMLQGGFGGGHLDYDRLLGILAMPWLFVP